MSKPPKDKRTKEYKKWLKENPEGLGDRIEQLTEATGIKKAVEYFANGKDCGCDKRKEKLNKLFPTRFKAARCLTEDEYNQYKEFKDTRTLRLVDAEIKFVCKLFASVFNRSYYEPCRNCSPKPIIRMIEYLDIVFDSYVTK